MIEIGAKIAKINDWKKSKNLSVYRVKIAILLTLLCYNLLRFSAKGWRAGRVGRLFYRNPKVSTNPFINFPAILET